MLHHLRLCTTEPELAPARELLTRVCKRDLYAFVGERILERHGGAVDRDDYARRLKNLVVAHVALGPDGAPVLTVADLEVMFVQIDYGMGDRNPVDLVGFFKKEGEGRRMPASKVSSMLPNTFSELYVVCFVQRCAAHTTCVALAALPPPPPPPSVWFGRCTHVQVCALVRYAAEAPGSGRGRVGDVPRAFGCRRVRLKRCNCKSMTRVLLVPKPYVVCARGENHTEQLQ